MTKCPKCDTEHDDTKQVSETCENPTEAAKMPKTDYAAVAKRAIVGYWPMWIAAALFVLMQWDFPFSDWWRSWRKPHSYYSHGPLVPLIALFMVWANRKRIGTTEPFSRSRWAVLVLVPSVVLFVLGRWVFGSVPLQVIGALGLVASVPVCLVDWVPAPAIVLVVFPALVVSFVFARWTGSGVVSALAFLGFLIGGAILLAGRRIAKLLLFPILYLGFMVPAPATLLDSVTFKIQLLSTVFAAKLLNFTGYPVERIGSRIFGDVLPQPLIVEGQCGGFRMLISLLTFAAFFVYMLRAPLWKKAVLITIAFPLSTFVNGLRIAAIGYVGIWTDSAKTMMSFHDSWAQVLELVVAFAILFGLAKLIKANDFGVFEPSEAGGSSGPVEKIPTGFGIKGLAVIVVFALVLMSNYAIQPLEATAKGFLNESLLPKSFGYWTSRPLQMDPAAAKELKTAANWQRAYRYTMDDYPEVGVLVQAAADTDAFHDPHSCIPGGGSTIVDEKISDLKFGKPTPMRVKATCITAVSPDQTDFILVYWYRTDKETYATTSQVRWKMRLAQIQDIRDLLLRRTTNEEVRKRTLERQTYCYRFQIQGFDIERDRQILLGFIKDFMENSGCASQ